MKNFPGLPYDPNTLPRELKRHYISASDEDLGSMLSELGLSRLDELFKYFPEQILRKNAPEIPDELDYASLKSHVEDLAKKNLEKTSFLGDSLPHYKTHEIVGHVLAIRGLTTSYTPYQPERSQGTLMTHWIYQCLMSQLTGFEAVNASLYDRATALFEAISCARRLKKDPDTVLVLESIHPNDLQVLRTHARGTTLKIEIVPLSAKTGTTDLAEVRKKIAVTKNLFALVFPQVNALGLLEDVHALADLAAESDLKSIAVIDPILLAEGGLVPPAHFGKKGTDLLVGEGQHLAIAPNFGGPGLGIFGIRFNEANKTDVRATSGRFVGKGADLSGREARVMVLSTREQHIRREKANSNICSNQAFLATLAGAAILGRGEDGMKAAVHSGRVNAEKAFATLTSFAGVKPAFPDAPFFNEFVLALPGKASALIQKASSKGLHVGVDVSSRIPGSAGNLLLISFSDLQTESDLQKLAVFFESEFGKANGPGAKAPAISTNFLRKDKVGIPKISLPELKAYYTALGEQNVSPDSSCFPLGSCTMKYNPYINDYAAGLAGFQNAHPAALAENVQGCLEIIFHTQEYFKAITGLAGVTTQPVAGAQGELVGLKLFQAWHASRGDAKRDLILIPRTAHGTNPATATLAGFENGVTLIEANADGEIDMADLKRLLAEHGPRVAGIMVTNPNTSGIFETRFREIADLVHASGGLVYMDGANMNAICGWADLGKMGVDAVHNNTHKTWSIPHGGGGPGDAFVAVSEKLLPFLPGIQVVRENGVFRTVTPEKSIGSFHRHFGNFGHKVRAYTYLAALGREGVRRISAVAVLSARYLQKRLSAVYPLLPIGAEKSPRLHEFIITLPPELFSRIEAAGIPKAQIMGRMGKLF
ncbi:MAG: aminotransferase class V-fold PLP-dependent enzyme, partial [Spirochaetia bacterium]|nr:aminotransferase class V-fold PLP-dependent enzyme [Spirochaetia bacterium]